MGTQPGKRRPCVAIQPNAFAAGGLPSTVVLPITTRVMKDALPLRVRVPQGTCGLTTDSDVMVDEILEWDNALFRRDLGVLPDALQDELRRAVRECLDV